MATVYRITSSLICLYQREGIITRDTLTAKAERIPHSRNADWRSDLCTQKEKNSHTGEIHSQPFSEGKEGERDCMLQTRMCCERP